MEKSRFNIGDLVRMSDEWFEGEEAFLAMIKPRSMRSILPYPEDVGIILSFCEMPEDLDEQMCWPYEGDGAKIHWFRKDIVCLSNGGWLTDNLSIVVKSLSS